MNVVIVNCFDTYEHRVDLLHDVLVEEGNSVRVITSDYRHFEKKKRCEKKKDYVFFHANPYKKNLSYLRLSSHVRLSNTIFQYLDRFSDIDVLWVLLPPNSFAKNAVQYKEKHTKVKLIFDVIDLWPETMPIGTIKKIFPFTIWKRLRDKYIKNADYIVTECNLFRSVLGRSIVGSRVKTLYLARKVTPYEPIICASNDIISLCYLGSINNIIDIDGICSVIKRFKKKRDVQLHIIGDGEKKEELVNACKVAGADVIFHGPIYDEDEKRSIFESCHYGLNIMNKNVCVGLTMKSIDYMEYGLPLINNIYGDTWLIIQKERIGYNIDQKFEDVNKYDVNLRVNTRRFFENNLSVEVFKKNVLAIVRGDENKVEHQVVRSSNYGIKEIIGNGVFLFRSKVLIPSSRLIRFPIVIRGRKWINFGKNLTTGRRCRIEVNGIFDKPILEFGKNVNIGDEVRISAAEGIKIGNNVLMGSRVLVIDNSHGYYRGDNPDAPNSAPNERRLHSSPIYIGDNVWIGEGAVIQMGVKIGKGSIIGANSVVTKSIPPNTIAAGVPAKVIKKYNEETGKWERLDE